MDCRPPGSSVHGDSPVKNTGVGCHALLQEIFPTQGSNPGLPHCGWILYHLSHLGSHLMKRQLIRPKTNFKLHLFEFAEWLFSEKPVCQNQFYPEKNLVTFVQGKLLHLSLLNEKNLCKASLSLKRLPHLLHKSTVNFLYEEIQPFPLTWDNS